MNIQILGIREYFDPKDKKTKKSEKFFEQGYRAPSVQDILANADEYLKNVPLTERFNLYFTTAECIEEKGRKLLSQKVIPFDIDGIDKSKIRETWFAACEALGLTPELNGAVYSGNGIWLFVKSHVEITDENYFDETRIYYKELCHKITAHLASKGLQGKADPTCWSPARLARMPNTLNKKKDKEDVMARTLNPIIEDEGFNFITASGVPMLGKEDQLDKHFMRGYPSPDAKEILSERGCGFLSWTKENANDVSEEQWYAMLGILDWLPNGRSLCHDYSRPYKGYSYEETERKANQAKENAGPRTCKNINGIWSKCGSCPHFNKITSPIQIRGEDFIVTEKTGFWSYKQTKDGNVVLNKPEVMDLVKHFKRNHEYVCDPETQQLFVFNGKFWEEKHTSHLLIYAKDHFNPSVQTYIYDEFKKNVLLTNVVNRDWFTHTTKGYFNMQNGIYDMEKDELIPHDRKFGFLHVLPYSYEKEADCPRFKKFLKEVTLDSYDLEKVLLEYSAYCIQGGFPWLQKALFLNGDGANGKSVFADILRSVVGENNASSQRLERLGNPNINALIENKLVNISEESSKAGFLHTEDFKELVGGGHMNVKRLYKNSYEVVNHTRFVMLSNGMPTATDGSHGFFRRLIIVPFNATFSGDKKDPFILKKLKEELSGIFNLLITNLKDLIKRGDIVVSNVAETALHRYAEDSDIAMGWIRDNLDIVETAPKEKWVSSTDMYQEYVQNCQYDWGIKPVSNINFWRKAAKALEDLSFQDRKVQARRNNKVTWVYKGIVRKELNDEQF